MTTIEIPVPDLRRGALRLWAVLGVVMSVFPATTKRLRVKTRPARSQLTDHFFSIMGFGCFSGAGFYHSIFAGLLVTGISLFLFELKVSE